MRSASAQRLARGRLGEDRGEFLAAEAAERSAGRICALALSAKTCSTRSPTAWPKRSLIDLKLSRSISSTAVGLRCAGMRASPCRSPSCRKARRLAMPVSGSTMAAVLWRCSVRSFAMASRMKAMAIVNSSASKLSTVSQTLLEHLVGGRPWQQRRQRRAQQEQRAMREQHEDRRPARDQRLAAAAPEFIGREPRIGGDDAGR